jgi:hypothetical protein
MVASVSAAGFVLTSFGPLAWACRPMASHRAEATLSGVMNLIALTRARHHFAAAQAIAEALLAAGD